MAYARRDQRHLAVDSNVLVAYLDREHPQHNKVAFLSSRRVALNPTVVHETYHTLVFKMKWASDDASEALMEMLEDTSILFVNQTRDTTKIGLRFAERYALIGSDLFILSTFHNPSIVLLTIDNKKQFLRSKGKHGRRKLI